MEKLFKLLFNIETDEIKPVSLIFLISFCFGISQMFVYTSANTIFLETYGASYLPYTFIFNMIFIPFFGISMLKIAEKIPFSILTIGVIGFSCTTLITFRILLTMHNIKWPSMAYLLWFNIECVLSGGLFLGILNRLFNIRQSKRLATLSGLGSDMAIMFSGFFIPFIIPLTGTLNLIPLAMMAYFISVFFFLWLAFSFPEKLKITREKIKKAEKETEKIPFKKLLTKKIVINLLIVSSLGAVTFCFVNNAYLYQTQSYFKDAAKLASFLAIFYSVTSIFVTIVKIFSATKFMKNFELSTSLLLTPIMTGMMALIFIIVSNISLITLWPLLFIVLLKVTQKTFNSTIQGSAHLNIIQSLPLKEKNRVATLSGTIAPNIMMGVSGVILLYITRGLHLGAKEICIALEVILVLWIIAAIFLGKEYRNNLSEMLNNKTLLGTELILHDSKIIHALIEGLQSKFPKEILYSIDMLDKANYEHLKTLISKLADHPDNAIRKKVAIYYENKGSPEDINFLMSCLQKEKEPDNIAAWLCAIASSGEGEQLEFIEPYLKNENPIVSMGAYTALIKHCGIEGILLAGNELTRLAHSSNKNDRKFAAETIGQIKLDTLYRILIPLLKDEDGEVRKSAIEAAGLLESPKLLSVLFENIDQHELRTIILKNLSQASVKILPALEKIYHDDPSHRKTIVYLYGKMPNNEVIPLLKDKLNEPNKDLLLEIIQSLIIRNYKPAQADIFTLEKILNGWTEYGAKILAALKDVSDKTENLITEALKNERNKTRHALFLIISLLYPEQNVKDAEFNYFYSNSEEKIAVAIEFLDNILNKEHKNVILPIMEKHALDTSLESLNKAFHNELLGKEKRLIEICDDQDVWQNSWLRAVAYYARMKQANGKNQLINPLQDNQEKNILDLISPTIQIDPETIFSPIDVVLIIHKVHLFSKIPNEIISEMVRYVQLEKHIAQKTIIHKGDPGSTMYIIVSGLVNVHVDEKIITELKNGDIFGELSAFVPELRTADITLLKNTILLAISQDNIFQIINEHVEIAEGIIQVLCQRIRNTIGIDKTPEEKTQKEIPPIQSIDSITNVEKLLIFKSLDVFNNVSDNILNNLAAISKEKELNPGEILMNKNDIGSSMYVVAKGKLKVYDQDKLITELGEREIVGELAALSSEPRSASVAAIEKTIVLEISQTSLYEIMRDQPAVALEFIKILTHRLRNLMV